MNEIYSPFRSLGSLHRELNRAFDDRYVPETSYVKPDWIPHVDIKETDDSFVVHVDVPGVNASDIDITLDRNLLTISGKRSTETKDDSEGYRRRERISGSFVRQFTLPQSADAEQISAKATNGVLDVTIPKSHEKKRLNIQVQSGD